MRIWIRNNKWVKLFLRPIILALAIIIGFYWDDLPTSLWESLCQFQGLLLLVYILNLSNSRLDRTFWALICALANVELISDINHENHDINHLDFIHIILATVVFLQVLWKDTLPYIKDTWKTLKTRFTNRY